MGKELLNEGRPSEVPVLGTLRLRCLCFEVLYVDCVSTRLKKAEPTVQQVRVDELRNQIIDQLRRDFLMDSNSEKVRVAVFKNEINFHPDSEDEHRHYERVVDLTAEVFTVQIAGDRRNRDEKLLHVIGVQRQSAKVPKDIPICQVTDKSDELGHV